MSITRDVAETAYSGDDNQNRGRKRHEHREDSNNGVCRQRHSKVSAVEIDYNCDRFNGRREALLHLLGGEMIPKRIQQLAESEETLLEERTSCLFVSGSGKPSLVRIGFWPLDLP
jgi:hypothetical protein